jgi:hypothetical protein
MKATLTFEIECGRATCAVSKGKFCKFFTYDMKGQCSCYLFGRVFPDETGWTQRHEACLKLSKEVL